jgi:hypothetical protein
MRKHIEIGAESEIAKPLAILEDVSRNVRSFVAHASPESAHHEQNRF